MRRLQSSLPIPDPIHGVNLNDLRELQDSGIAVPMGMLVLPVPPLQRLHQPQRHPSGDQADDDRYLYVYSKLKYSVATKIA